MHITPQLNPSSAAAFRIALLLVFCGLVHGQNQQDLNNMLAAVLKQAGFTGSIQATLEPRLGRPINPKLANLGRLLWFDKIHALHDDNTCAGCHSPTNGFGDSQSIAIGIQNSNIVGHNRTGPRNQRHLARNFVENRDSISIEVMPSLPLRQSLSLLSSLCGPPSRSEAWGLPYSL